MSPRTGTGRAQRRLTASQPPRATPPRATPPHANPARASAWRLAAMGIVVVGVLGAGLILGFGDFFGRPEAGTAQALPVRLSMAGFDPGVIIAKAGQPLTIELWTTDAAPHLQGGVHTMISDELGFREELPAESRRTVTIQMPATPGDYDIYCDTCCGGKGSPTMHATLRVEA